MENELPNHLTYELFVQIWSRNLSVIFTLGTENYLGGYYVLLKLICICWGGDGITPCHPCIPTPCLMRPCSMQSTR